MTRPSAFVLHPPQVTLSPQTRLVAEDAQGKSVSDFHKETSTKICFRSGSASPDNGSLLSDRVPPLRSSARILSRLSNPSLAPSPHPRFLLSHSPTHRLHFYLPRNRRLHINVILIAPEFIVPFGQPQSGHLHHPSRQGLDAITAQFGITIMCYPPLRKCLPHWGLHARHPFHRFHLLCERR